MKWVTETNDKRELRSDWSISPIEIPFFLIKSSNEMLTASQLNMMTVESQRINFIRLQDASRTICRNWKYLLNLAAMMNIRNTYKSMNMWMYICTVFSNYLNFYHQYIVKKWFDFESTFLSTSFLTVINDPFS